MAEDAGTGTVEATPEQTAAYEAVSARVTQVGREMPDQSVWLQVVADHGGDIGQATNKVLSGLAAPAPAAPAPPPVTVDWNPSQGDPDQETLNMLSPKEFDAASKLLDGNLPLEARVAARAAYERANAESNAAREAATQDALNADDPAFNEMRALQDFLKLHSGQVSGVTELQFVEGLIEGGVLVVPADGDVSQASMTRDAADLLTPGQLQRVSKILGELTPAPNSAYGFTVAGKYRMDYNSNRR